MADEPDPKASAPDSSPESPREKPASRRKPMTPELRRFLGPGRSWREREAAKQEEEQEVAESADLRAEPQAAAPVPVWPPIEEPSPPARQPRAPQPKPERFRTPPPVPAVVADQKISRALEMQTVALVVGGFILLGGAFYAGTKIHQVKALFTSRKESEIANVDSKKFPGLTADELVEQALAAERLGNWHETVERLLVAKRRNLLYRGILFHAGKLCYDHGDFDSADRLLERAIAFGDQVDTANYLRGLIATGRNDLPAAEQFFEAAITAEPFTPGYYYYLGETLRRENRPGDAIARYEQAATRTVNEQDAALCRFKARLARAETADHSQLQTEIDRKRSSGPLTADWLLTDAALKIRSGEPGEAALLIQQARSSDEQRLTTLFASCISDMLFTAAAANHPEIAAACRSASALGSTPTPSPSPFASP